MRLEVEVEAALRTLDSTRRALKDARIAKGRAKRRLEQARTVSFLEPKHDGAVIRISARHRPGQMVYHWAAVRGGNRWHLTGGSNPRKLSWDELLACVTDDLHDVVVDVMTPEGDED